MEAFSHKGLLPFSQYWEKGLGDEGLQDKKLTPMPEASPTELDRTNQQALAELCRLLRFSQGEFELILAVCNSTRQRQALVDQLRQECPIPFDEITLAPTTTTLFTTLRDSLSSPPPHALMVYGLAGVHDLEQMLTATNQIREEFRQFPFPLVLWLTDRGLKQLIRTAPDFYTWANPVTFETPPAFFLAFLDELTQDVWQQVLQSRENRFLSNQELGLTPSSDRYQELETSLAALAANKISLTVEQSADLAFVQGRIADNNTPTAREHYEQSLAQWQDLFTASSPHSPTYPLTHSPSPSTKNPYTEKIGHVQFYLGLWWRNQAERYRQTFKAACNRACEYFEAAVQTLESAQRSDLAAQYFNYWAESLHRLERWPELDTVATQALALHQQQQRPFRVARAEGFLAEAALSRQDWPAAQRHAEAALALIQPIADSLANVSDSLLNPLTSGNDGPLNTTMLGDLDTSDQLAPGNAEAPNPSILGALEEDIAFCIWINSFHRSWYLFSLGRAQFGQGQVDAAVTTLEQARAVTEPEYDPALYSRVLEQLRQGYFQQGKYLPAFETRRQKDAIESRFNFQAFVGAGRLQPKQKIANPALPVEANKDAIMASGRKHDVQRLVKRLAQDENVLTIVYGPSGVGKSSLIEAGLVPALEQTRLETRQVVPIYLRRYRDWTGDLLTTLADLAAGHAPSDSGILRYPKPQEVSPIIRFRSRPAPSNKQSPPSQEEIVSEKLRRRTQRNQVMVLIFDQFEEFFFEFEQAADRRPFYDFLRNCLAMPFIKVVLSLREDYIHYLLECDRLTNLEIIDNNILDKKWLYYLGNFSPEDTQAIFQELTDPTPYNPEPILVDRVVTDLAAGAGEIRPIELQIVGAQLQREKITSLSTYQDWGDPNLPTKELLVQKYLTDIVKECGPEEQQRMADIVLYLLTDEKGTRPLKTKSNLAEDLCTFTNQTKLDDAALSLVLQILTRSGLVMEVPESPEDFYQLVHDYLAAFIRSLQQPLMAQLEQERQMRTAAEQQQIEEQQKRLAAERKQRKLAQRAAVGLGAFALVAVGVGGVAWFQRQRAVKGEVNAQFLAQSLAMETKLETGLEEAAVTQAMQTAQNLQGKKASLVEPDNRFRAISSIHEVMFGVKEKERLIGHNASVFSVAFSPDGETIATASGDNTVKLWNIAGEELQTLKGQSNVAFSPDGETLATASQDNTVKLWNLVGEELQTLKGHSAAVLSVAFSPDGETLATASGDNTVKLWNLAGEELQTLKGHSDTVLRVAFSSDGETLATASGDNTVKLWNLAGEELQTLKGHSDAVFSVTFSPDGDTLATASQDNTVKLWNLVGEELQTLKGHSATVWSVAFSPDGKTLATASQDNTVKLWNIAGEELQTLKGHSDEVFSVTFGPDGETIATASRDHTVKLWNLAGEEQQTLKGHSAQFSSVAFSPDGETIATASRDHTAKLWNLAGEELQTLKGHGDGVLSVTFGPDGETLATASEDHTAKLWNLAGEEQQTLKGHSDGVLSVAFSPDSEMIATASRDHTVKLWNLAGEELQTLKGHSDAVLSVTFGPDSEMIATASRDHTVKLWNLAGEELQTLKGHRAAVLSVAFSSDGETLATASWNNAVKLWSLAGEDLQTLKGHSAAVSSVAFSPDGETLATASLDNTVKLWSLAGEDLQTLKGHSAAVSSVAFSPDGETLATASEDNTVKLWNFRLEDLVAKGCNWLGTYFVKQSPELLVELEVCQENNPLLTIAAAPLLVDKGEALARAGKVQQATALLQHAVNWDSRLKMQPQTRAENLDTAQTLVTEAEDLAKAGQISEATAKFTEAKKLDTDLDFEPETRAKTIGVQTFIAEAEELAKAGQISEATTKFIEAKKLDPELDFTPETQAKELAIEAYLAEGRSLVNSGNVEAAVQAYRQAESVGLEDNITARDWNSLCWNGSLYNQAEKVLFACEKAVDLTPEHGGRIDSRGLARALTGDLQGAIDDFRIFVEWTSDENERTQRQAWIETLERGENPFTAEVLEMLKGE